MARLLGVRANRAIMLAFAPSGVLAAAVAFVQTVQGAQVISTFGAPVTIFALIGAVIGGFAVGFALSELRTWLPSSLVSMADVFVFLLVIVALAVRPSGLLAALVASVLMRLNGLQAGIATFAFLAVVNEMLANWKAIGPASSQQGFFFSDPSISMQTLLFIAIAAIIVSWLYQRSTTARLLRATRKGLTAAPASGINVRPHRIIALTVSGALCSGPWSFRRWTSSCNKHRQD
ncbi:MAG: ABC transporter permease subunit [Mycobacteriaceae bacterium]